MANNDDEVIAGLVGAGIIALASYGLYRFIKSFGEHSAGDTISANEVSTITLGSYSRNYDPPCRHDNPVLCSSCNKCIECSGGDGDTSTPDEPLCSICGYYDSGDDE